MFGVFLGSRLNLRWQRTALEHTEKAKVKLSDGFLGLTLAEIVQNARTLIRLHKVIDECRALLHEQGANRAQAYLMNWLSLYEFKDCMWRKLASLEVTAEKDSDALLMLTSCYSGVENTIATAKFITADPQNTNESSLSSLIELVALRCSELASRATCLLFTHKGLWDTILPEDNIMLLAELHMENLKADQIVIIDEDVRKAMHEAIAGFRDRIIDKNNLLARNCDQALDALGLNGIERLSNKEKARSQKKGLLPKSAT
jgi:hypothetical protein